MSNKKDNRFFSQTFSFAAEVPEGISFPKLAQKGIFGGFSGRFVTTPYYKINEAYNINEQRSLFEYEMSLTKDEQRRLLLHAYELLDVTIGYTFFTNNCAFETLWLIQAARPDVDIISSSSMFVEPYETIKTLKGHNFIASEKVSQSSIEHLQSIYEKMDQQNKDLFLKYKDSNGKPSFADKIDASSMKNEILYLTSGYYELLFKRYKIGRSDYEDVVAAEYFYPSSSFSGGRSVPGGQKAIFSADSGSGTGLELYTYSLDREDERNGYASETTLNILGLSLEKKGNNEKISRVVLLDIESLAKRTAFTKPVSWSLGLGVEESMKSDSKMSPFISFGVGASYGENDSLLYFMPTARASTANGESLSFGAVSGLSFWHNGFHFGADAEALFSIFDKDNYRYKVDVFASKSITDGIVAKLKYHEGQDVNKGNITLSASFAF